MEKSLKFYRDTLGLKETMNIKIKADPLMMDLPGTDPYQHLVMLSTGNSHVELIQYVKPRGKNIRKKTCDIGVSHICFQVDDINEAYKKMLDKGINTFHRTPDFIGEQGGSLNGYGYVYFRGPDNEILEFIQVPSHRSLAKKRVPFQNTN
jgi:catechol 2,3-dioxygenase-like lactoylglutathione lyase family enzyme